jgi:4-hydroxy-tetrahydrodipicolinate synthase
VPVLAGTGQSGTAKTIAQTQPGARQRRGIALVVTPPYVRPTQPGLLEHYRQVSAQGGLPTGAVQRARAHRLRPAAGDGGGAARGSQHHRLKEARGDEARWDALYPLGGAAFALLSGDDPTFRARHARRRGGRGVGRIEHRAARLRAPEPLLREGREDEAAALDARLQPVYDFCGIESNPIPVKAVLRELGIGAGLRLPLLPLSPRHQELAVRVAGLCREIESQLQ